MKSFEDPRSLSSTHRSGVYLYAASLAKPRARGALFDADEDEDSFRLNKSLIAEEESTIARAF